MIATSYLQNYPHTRQIFADMGHSVVNMTSYKQIDKIAFSGLILLGGPDIQPALYGQTAKYPHLSRANWQRDQIEWYLLKTALEREKPVLAVCRGMQLLNVACGGSLWQDLKRDKVGEVDHRAYHSIMARGSLAGKIPLTVNSRHHQAINYVATGFEPVAYAEDGIIEAIYKPGALGVQWHPEDLYFEDERWSKLFEWFLAGLK